jgi:hypothetical protein
MLSDYPILIHLRLCLIWQDFLFQQVATFLYLVWFFRKGICFHNVHTKCQLKSELILEVLIFQNSKENIVRISALKFFTDHILFTIAYIYKEGANEKNCASKY